MTRHNLSDHLSWLINNRHIPPTALSTPNSGGSTAAVESVYAAYSNANSINTDSTRLETQTTQHAPGENALNQFARPAPPSSTNQDPQRRGDPTLRVIDNAMARLQSAGRPNRPTLVNQYQTVTPASTTGSSLTASWAASFHKDGMPLCP